MSAIADTYFVGVGVALVVLAIQNDELRKGDKLPIAGVMVFALLWPVLLAFAFFALVQAARGRA